MQTITKILFTLILFSFFCLPAQAQKKQRFQGDYRNKLGEKGTADFFYIEKKGETILDGKFDFQAQYPDSVQAQKFIKKRYTGTYSKNLKEGKWTYNFKDYDIFINDVNNLTVDHTINGHYTVIDIAYKAGKPHGNWNYSENFYENNRLAGTVRKGSGTFANGRLDGPFYFEDTENEALFTLKGEFNKGYLHNSWQMKYTQDTVQILETRQYKNGFLLEVKKENAQSRQLISQLKYTDVAEQLKALENKEKDLHYKRSDAYFGLTFQNGYAAGAPEQETQQFANELLNSSLNKLLGDKKEIYSAAADAPMFPAATGRFVYELKPQQQQAIDSLAAATDSVNKRVSILLDNESLKVNHQRTDSLAFMYQFLKHAAAKSDSAKALFSVIKSDSFKYYNPEIFLKNSISFFAKPDTVAYQYDSVVHQRAIQYNRYPADSQDVFASLNRHFGQLEAGVAQAEKYIAPHLMQFQGENQLQSLESRISRKMDEVADVYNPKEPFKENALALNYLHANLYQTFAVSRLNEKMQAYSNETDIQKKLNLGQDAIDLLTTLQEIAKPVADIPYNQEVVDKTYITTMFDPFTYSENIEARAKKKLYKKGAEDLYQHYLEELTTETNYRNLVQHVENIHKLHQKLLQLRHANTNRLERRLGRAKTFNRIAILLEIN